jgi:ubiquinone/menaquinone biosynthesis C-methylase UbiE
MSDDKPDLRTSYDRVAEEYAAEYFNELHRKPFDRDVLNAYAESVRGPGEVCEIGCGPGQIARYLKDRGVTMRGIDLSDEMIKCASRLSPDIPFACGNMLSLNADDESFAGIVSFYAIIHLERADLGTALKEMQRTLQPGGKLLLAFHGGEGELHRDEWYEKPVSVDVRLYRSDEMRSHLEVAGFAFANIAERQPYEFEYPTKRLYASAIKP